MMWIIAVISGICIVHAFVVGVYAGDDWPLTLSSSITINDVEASNPVTELVDTLVGISVHQCVKQCNQRLACDAINYRFVANLCELIRHVNKDMPLHTGYRKGYAYGRNTDWDITATDMCQREFEPNLFTTAVLQDESSVNFMVVLDEPHAHSDAEKICEENDAHLFQVSTVERLQFIFELTSCAAFADASKLWVDGEKASDDVFRTWDNQTMPMISGHWRDGDGSSGQDGNCACVNRDYHGFKMIERECTNALPYICEKN